LEAAGDRLQRGLEGALRAGGVTGRVQRVGSMWTLFFGDGPIVDYDAAKRCSTERFSVFFNGMLDRGVLLPPSQFEACFISGAHDDAAIDATIDAAHQVLSRGL
ncbi:MAG: aspartate aminotransferase family protein, partial [Myxococcales bacterium]|nr:aspartate aminotransferase family protein [Myxococcales bacterium]